MTETVPIDSIRAHPLNARRGDLGMLRESLQAWGFIRPIIVNQDGVIVAGHNVWQAAKSLGWQHVPIHRISVNPEEHRAMMVADNRTSDLATWNMEQLGAVLSILDDLTGTGFDSDELEKLTKDVESGAGSLDTPEPPPLSAEPEIKVGWFLFHVRREQFDPWYEALLEQSGSPRAARKHLRRRLRLPEQTRHEPELLAPEDVPAAPVLPLEEVPAAELVPMTGNARQGDIGAIGQSLRRFGQFKPLVITADNVVIAGNHTLQAAIKLGFKRVQVVRLHLPLEDAVKVGLMDNRSADVSTYDDEKLRALVGALASYDGTGFDLWDVNDLLSGGPSRPTRQARTVQVKVEGVTFRVPRKEFSEWARELPVEMECVEIAQRLGLDVDSCIF